MRTLPTAATRIRRPVTRVQRGQTALLFVAIAVIFLAAPPVLGQADFSVDRQRIELSVDPGGEVVGSFRVHNRSDAPLPIRVTPVDYTVDELGRILTPDAGTTERSLLPHLVVSPTSFTIEPGGYTDVRYVVNAPDDMQGSHWIAFLTRRGDDQPSSVDERGGDGVSIQFRFHVVYRTLMVVTARGTEQKAARVTGLRRLESENGLSFAVNVLNEGNTNFRGTGRIEIRDAQGATVTTVPFGAMSILPGHERTLSTSRSVDGLAPGEYIALAIVDFGGDYLTAGQLRFPVR